MSVVYIMKPYKKSTAGWTIGIQFQPHGAQPGLSADVAIADTFNTMKLTKISKNRDYLEFQATQDFSDFNAFDRKRVPFVVNFRNTNEEDRKLIMNSDMHIFSEPAENTHCLVDRFECFPTIPNM